MIYSLTINDPSNLPIPWWPNIEALSGTHSFTFKRGLNILWGRNGSGKSSLLRLIARWFHAEQGGYSVVTPTSCRALREPGESEPRAGASFVHDGQAVYYADPDAAVGLRGGSFDDDFLLQGVQAIIARGSSGETTLHRVNSVVAGVVDRKPHIEYRAVGSDAQQVRALLQANASLGPRTLLLDEPDKSVDLDHRHQMWTTALLGAAKKVQLLAATHCPLALHLDGASYIELSPGYLDRCRQLYPRQHEQRD